MKEQILKNAEVADRDAVYCIGSFGARVNFHAQQNRALNLVWALCEDGQLKSGTEVAVIGGGITGLTLAAGLISLGCRVDVFETAAFAVHRQIESHHRMAHPTINAWPKVLPSVTTQLPFLEWHMAKCSVVAKALKKQYDELTSAFEAGRPDSKRSRFLEGCFVEEIIEPAAGLVMIHSNRNESTVYRLAIIAVGFGKERSPGLYGTLPYWDADNLEGERNSNSFARYVVSGGGDGGLIDALRVVHVDFDFGMLAFAAAAALHGTEVAKKIEDAEIIATKSLNPDAGALEKSYSDAAELLYSDATYGRVQDMLSRSLGKFSKLAFLTDTSWNPPFSLNAAPIHKLLLAHAKRGGKVIYAKGGLIDNADRYELDGKTYKKSETKVIVRHGADAKPTLNHLISASQVEDLKEKQKHLSDYVITRYWATSFPMPPGAPPHDPNDERFVQSREELAEDAVREMRKDGRVVALGNRFEVTFRGEVPPVAVGNLFGIETEYKVAPIVSLLPG